MSRRHFALCGLAWLASCDRAGSPDGTDGPGDTEPPLPACADAVLTPQHTAAGTTLNLPVEPDGPARVLASRAIVIDAAAVATGGLSVALDGPAALLGDDGAALTLPLELAPGDLPRTVWIAATELGDATLTATPEEGCAAATLSARGARHVELAARTLGEAPWAAHTQTWRVDEPVALSLDPAAHADRVGLDYDVYVVPHKAPGRWLAEPDLVDASGGAEQGTVSGSLEEDTRVVWTDPEVQDVFASTWDLVVDFGRDGRLDPGDLIDGLGPTPGFWTTGDLTAAGPWTVETRQRDDGGFLTQQVWWPADPSLPPNPLPLVIISHGNGHDYRWYDHLGEHLASWGFVVMSHENNTGPGVETASTTTLTNTEHFVANHASWWSGALDGHVDVHNIAWIGHSRGGEGVVRAIERLRSGDWTTDVFTTDDVRFISSIAPTVFLGVGQSSVGNKPYHLIAGGADGDVTGGADCDICQYLRLPYAAAGPISVTYLHGASHNKFHNGGGWDDSTGPAPLDRADVHAVQKAVYLALLSWQQRGVTGMAEWMANNWEVRRPMGVPASATVAQVLRADLDGDDVRVIDRFQVEEAPETNDLGGNVAWTADEVSEGSLDDNNAGFNWASRDVFNGMTHVERDGFERGGTIGWDDEATYATRLPEGARDVRAFDFLSLAAGQSSRHPATVAHDGPLGFHVQLEDGAGALATLDAATWGLITPVYPRTGLGAGAGWATEMNTIRIPLRAFQAETGALDLADIRAIRLLLGPAHGAATGRLVIDDIYLGRTE